MPIRINILAEQQALEEMRRKDPVKRAIWVGVLLSTLVLGWGIYLFGQSILKKNELSTLETALNTKANEYKLILENKKRLDDINFKLNDLNRLATNRFLMGNLLNALQQGTMDNVQVVRIRLDEKYLVTEAVKATKPKDGEKGTPAKPGKSTEKIMLTIDAKDSSADAGSAISKFQEKLSELPYFSSTWSKPLEFKLTHRGAPLGDISGRMAVLFTLECSFPEITR